MEASSRPLTLDDLEYMKPEFICNVLVDNWQIENAPDKPKYELLTLTPRVIERLDRKKGQRQVGNPTTSSSAFTRERERERRRETETKRDRNRETERQKQRDRDRETETERTVNSELYLNTGFYQFTMVFIKAL